jgi:pyruvate dehydrogenase E1 component
LTVTNEPLPMPSMPEGSEVRNGILEGLYRFKPAQSREGRLQAQLLGSGTILYEALKAQQILEDNYQVDADVWSVTSYKRLYNEANECERWNRLHPLATPRVPYVTQCLKNAPGVFVAASDYMKVLPESIAQWIPGPLVALGTDGFGRSEDRATLRNFFEVDAKHIVLATLQALAREGAIGREKVEKAIRELAIDPEKTNPVLA